MIQLSVSRITDRGLKAFDALQPLERDVFVLNDLDLYFEMEGDFADYVLANDKGPQLDWLASTLERIGDGASLALLRKLRAIPASNSQSMSPICERFYRMRQNRWHLLQQYLLSCGAEVVE
jgi:hypothetical protein